MAQASVSDQNRFRRHGATGRGSLVYSLGSSAPAFVDMISVWRARKSLVFSLSMLDIAAKLRGGCALVMSASTSCSRLLCCGGLARYTVVSKHAMCVTAIILLRGLSARPRYGRVTFLEFQMRVVGLRSFAKGRRRLTL